MPEQERWDYLIIGAGPAGLTAAYELVKRGEVPLVLEKDPRYVGGISRTERAQGYRFDIGGHRFFSKSEEVMEWWKAALGNELLERPRSSQIYYNQQFFSYPLRAGEVLLKLGIVESSLCVFSYLRACLFPLKPVRSFRDWVVNHFGERLFNIFFKSYTEKVWGMSCDEISAEWAAQRIKGLSFFRAALDALANSIGLGGQSAKKEKTVKTLITSFLYPKYGPGYMWETVAETVQGKQGRIEMGAQPAAIARQADGRYLVTVASSAEPETGAAIGTRQVSVEHIISSMPIAQLAEILELSPAARQAAQSLRYRDFVTVALFMEDNPAFSDNWIYIHDPKVKVGRIQNYKSWSPYMVPDSAKECYGLEYFCHKEDDVWSRSDEELIAFGEKELRQLGLVGGQARILGGHVVRQEKAYPVYDQHYKEAVATVRRDLEAHHPHIHLVGRNGMHKYNNQDHAMMTAILTVSNIIDGTTYDIWEGNEDAEYHEQVDAGRQAALGSLMPTPGRVPSGEARNE